MKNRSVRSIVLDFVKANGPQPYSKLKEVVLIAAGQPINRWNYGSGYLDSVTSGSACLPNRNDHRYLGKRSDGLYHLVEY